MNIKEKAIKMRRNGLSYNEISRRLGMPKSTMSYWFKNLNGSANTTIKNRKRASNIWSKNITRYNKQRSVNAREKRAADQINAQNIALSKYIKYPLFILGTALYWAEGYKKGEWTVVFTNSDERMNRIMLKFFIDFCQVSTNKIRAQIQVHSPDQINKSINYWSKILKLSKNRFLKTVVQKNGNKIKKVNNKLPFGTLRIKINDVQLISQIKGWIDALAKYYSK